jgi:putative transposase
MPDHVRMMISVPPKYAVSQAIGHIEGKSAIDLARVCGERRRDFAGRRFWARGYFLSIAGRDAAMIRDDVKNLDKEDQRPDRLNLWR